MQLGKISKQNYAIFQLAPQQEKTHLQQLHVKAPFK